jgi:hypothetical protein
MVTCEADQLPTLLALNIVDAAKVVLILGINHKYYTKVRRMAERQTLLPLTPL